jgi:glutathione S-transferase
MMTLFWSSRSPYVRKVMVAAHECGLVNQITRERVDVATVRPNANVIAHNPLGKIPTLVLEDGTSLYDSCVICEYFHLLTPQAGLLPAVADDRFQALRLQALGNGMMDVLVMGRAEAARPDGSRSEPHVAAFGRKLDDIFAALDREIPLLSRLPLTIGALTIGCALDYANFRLSMRDWRGEQPALAHWHETFRQRSSMLNTAHHDTY